MKYRVDMYAAALADVLANARTREEEKKALANFTKLAIRNGEAARIAKILSRTEEFLAKRGAGDLVTVETARPLSPALRREIEAHVPKKTLVRETITPALGAGVRITVNGSRELDATLKSRLDRLFHFSWHTN